MRNPSGHFRRRAFTLVELLVVVVIVAAFSVIGFHGYEVARVRANESVSATNIRQLAAANLLHVAEHGTYVLAGDPSNNIRWHGARTSSTDKFDPTKGLLADYLGKSRMIGACPEFRRHLSGSDSWEDGSGGYGYNAVYVGGVPTQSFKPNTPAGVRNPARTIMFATTAFAKAEGLQEYASADPPFSVDANWRMGRALQPSIHFRFNGRALVAWCDGHVSTELPSAASSTNFYGGKNAEHHIGFCGPSENNGWWSSRND